jgi:integrase
MSLTDKAIKAAKPKKTEYLLNDGGGLYLRVKPNGSKLWRAEFRVVTGRVRMPLGKYPQVSLKDARDAALDAKSQAKRGIDPRTNRKQKQEAILATSGTGMDEEAESAIAIDDVTSHSPFRTLALAWFNGWKVGKDARFVKKARARLTDNILSALGGMEVNDVRPRDLIRMARAIEKRLGRATDLASRSIQVVNQIYRFGVVHEVADRNPAADIKPSEVGIEPVVVKNRARVEREDLPKLLVAIDEYKGRIVVKLALKMMVLVFLRTSEMIDGVWPEIDFRESLWRIPAGRMKGRKAQKRAHIVPLARQALEILATLKKLKDRENENIFPGVFSKDGRIHGNSLLEALDLLGYQGAQTGHGFRGLANTILLELGYEEKHIDVQLAHNKRSRVKQAYDHAKYLDQRKVLMQGWADYIDQQLALGYAMREEKLGVMAQAGD